MSARQHRAARRIAYAEAKRSNLWAKGEDEVKSKWWRRLLWLVWRPFRRLWTGRIARWYRLNLKRYAHDLATNIEGRRRDEAAFRTAQKKVHARRLAAKLNSGKAPRKETV